MEELLKDVKQYLRITWDEDDDLLTGYLNRGKTFLQNTAEQEIDFHEEALPRALLFDYVLYANANMLPDFRKNYKDELLTLYLAYHGGDYDDDDSQSKE